MEGVSAIGASNWRLNKLKLKEGLGSRVWGLGFGVWGLDFRV